jgi:tRNA threonylcarbamoyladenosine biosynthesis protein TsaB
VKILALELSTGRGTIAWREDAAEAREVAFANDRKHSGLFFQNLQETLQRFGTPELIVVGLGPGSYAGTRIAIATATGLQATTGARLIGISSLRAFESEADEYCVIGDARRQSFFFARVARRECTDGPLLCTRDELIARLGANTHPVFASENIDAVPDGAVVAFPSARILAEIAATASGDDLRAPLEPIYLREPHITQPKSASMPMVQQ